MNSPGKKIIFFLGMAIAVILALVWLKSKKVPQTAFIPKTALPEIDTGKPLILDLDHLETIKRMEKEGGKAAESKQRKQEASEGSASALNRLTEVYRSKKLKANLKPAFSTMPEKSDSMKDLKKKAELNFSVNF